MSLAACTGIAEVHEDGELSETVFVFLDAPWPTGHDLFAESAMLRSCQINELVAGFQTPFDISTPGSPYVGKEIDLGEATTIDLVGTFQ